MKKNEVMDRILVIDDEQSIRNALQEILGFEDFKVFTAENGKQGLDSIKAEQPNVVMCDIKMPGMDGIEVLEKIVADYPELPVIMISGHGDIETAVEALKKGAFDYLQKPLDLNRVLVTVRNALDKKALVQETKVLKNKIHKSKSTNMIGESEEILAIKEMIEKVAPTEARVLITGQNGTGKELVARQLHDWSSRKNEMFVEVNCAAIPAELIESELFGHEKGAFTSAIKQKKGKFEQATTGTLFLDEIGDMSLSAQAKVLRALQENKITRVGGEKDIKVSPRILAATNKDLRKEIELGNFREDLYHRLSVILIHVPTLNERSEDIPELASFFMKQISAEYGNSSKILSDDAMLHLKQINWTGNIRELRNAIERLVILGEPTITSKDVKQFIAVSK
ncbi:MAG: two-component system nitrogen regulation response regulator NtrX [Flavobacteriales bacterium]